MTNHLAFKDHQFTPICRSNQIWLTSKDIAIALGYSKTNAITKIYNQNSDEFSTGMTEIVESRISGKSEVPKSATSGNLKARIRIFSLRGAHLIAMLARTPIAKEFRRWVLDILDREISLESPTPAPLKNFPADYKYYAEVKNGVTTHLQIARENEAFISPESFRELMERAGWLMIHCDELKNMTIDEFMKLGATSQKTLELWKRK